MTEGRGGGSEILKICVTLFMNAPLHSSTFQCRNSFNLFIFNFSFSSRRTVNVVNLDPAAEYFDYQPLVDIRDLVSIQLNLSDL